MLFKILSVIFFNILIGIGIATAAWQHSPFVGIVIVISAIINVAISTADPHDNSL